METDKETLNMYFVLRNRFETTKKLIKDDLRRIDRIIKDHNKVMYSAASECILDTLINSEPLTYLEIKTSIMAKESRFTELDVRKGLENLVSGSNPKIERRVSETDTGEYVKSRISTYMRTTKYALKND